MSAKYIPYGMEQRYTTEAHEYFDEVLISEKHLNESVEDLEFRYKELSKYKPTTFANQLERRDRAIEAVKDILKEHKNAERDHKKLVINQRYALLLGVLIALVSFFLGRCFPQ